MKPQGTPPRIKFSQTRTPVAAAPALPSLSSSGIVPEVSCEQCCTAEYLVFEQVRPVVGTDPLTQAWDVECWCGKCEQFYGIRTSRRPASQFSGPQVEHWRGF